MKISLPCLIASVAISTLALTACDGGIRSPGISTGSTTGDTTGGTTGTTTGETTGGTTGTTTGDPTGGTTGTTTGSTTPPTDDTLVPPPPAHAALCAPGGPVVKFTGSIASSDTKTYHMLPFNVAAGTGRIEMTYGWTDNPGLPSTPLTATTLDLGLWDQHGYRSNAGFRGWSGSRQGRIDQDHGPIYVEAAAAERGYRWGKIEPGVWYADLGYAATGLQGATWQVNVTCKIGGGTTPADDPVDRTHVARSGPGWFNGDFHMHAYHSNPNGPSWEDFIAQARAAKLDFLMVTDYVTTQHWRTLGAVQRANPDLLIWPGREIITYHGHVMGHGETPHLSEFRHGFEDVKIGDIQKAVKADGALFQVNHPTSFPPPVFSNFCRGCYFELADQIDWSQVDTIEVLNGPLLATADDLGIPLSDPQIENPFMTTALALWDLKLSQGYKITGVSGTDSKGVDAPADRQRVGYGSSATSVYVPELSRAAMTAAIKAGHAYVKTIGVARSPTLMFEANTADGQHAIFGDTLKVVQNGTATLKTTVSGASGQLLSYYSNGLVQATSVTLPASVPLPNGVPVPVRTVLITSDPFVDEFVVGHNINEGPLGTYWRVETRDLQKRTTIGNPIFLKAP